MLRHSILSLALICAACTGRAQSVAPLVSARQSTDSASSGRVTGTRITNFAGGAVDQHITLNWETVTESGINEFVVEHAAPGGEFAAVGTVKAKGSGKYDFRYKSGSGQARLRIIKTNGESKFTTPLSLTVNAQVPGLEASPNPATAMVRIQGLSFGDQATLIAANGQALRSFTATRTSEQLNLEGLPTGIYLLQVRSSGGDSRPALRIVKR